MVSAVIMYRDAGAGDLCKGTQHQGIAPGNDMTVFVPEIEEVAHDIEGSMLSALSSSQRTNLFSRTRLRALSGMPK